MSFLFKNSMKLATRVDTFISEYDDVMSDMPSDVQSYLLSPDDVAMFTLLLRAVCCSDVVDE